MRRSGIPRFIHIDKHGPARVFMQNIDFHNRRLAKNFPAQYAQFEPRDPEYFSQLSENYHHDEERGRKKANRMMSLIIALCIISFTCGLVTGIKFTSGSNREIVDKRTREAVSDFGKRMSSIVNERASAQVKTEPAEKKDLFPRDKYPYVIKIGGEFSKTQSLEIAQALNAGGHTVILSKHRENYRIYTGPFKTQRDAENSLKKITSNSNKAWFQKAHIQMR